VALTGSFSPFTIPAWSAALQAVDRSPSCLVEISKASKHFGHYVFPDPGLLVTPAANEKKAKFIEAWLRAREALLMRVMNEASVAMSGQNWRDFLATDLSTTSEKDTKAAKCRQQILDKLMPRSDLFPVKTRSTTGEPMFWQGRKYIPTVLPADQIIREILWELYQLNFYYELLSLDRCNDRHEYRQKTYIKFKIIKISTKFKNSTLVIYFIASWVCLRSVDVSK
jgi:hypothetical protein